MREELDASAQANRVAEKKLDEKVRLTTYYVVCRFERPATLVLHAIFMTSNNRAASIWLAAV